MNGNRVAKKKAMSKRDADLLQLTLQLRNQQNEEKYAKFHGDNLIGNAIVPKVGTWGDVKAACQPSNWPALARSAYGYVTGGGIDGPDLARIAGSLSDYSINRNQLINGQVKDKYDKMLHPPLTYLGDAFQYRTADGKFNSAITPHLGQAGAPYAKTVPSKTAMLGALPDPSELFDKLMAREDGGRNSESGLSAMLIYHATIIIHDIFRTNDNDKNISDSSSYLDLSPLYGFTTEMQRKIRDDKYKLGLLKPDTFAEDRLLRQPPGVCIMLVMYNRYHNYAARQLLRINENGRFQVPDKYKDTKLVSLVKELVPDRIDDGVRKLLKAYEDKWREAEAKRPRKAQEPPPKLPNETPQETKEREEADHKFQQAQAALAEFDKSEVSRELEKLTDELDHLIDDEKHKLAHQSVEKLKEFEAKCAEFEVAWQAAWDKLDDDLFNTARLITCGMYIQISVHDYLRALMGFHEFDTNFTLDPRADFDQKKTSRGVGNQVTVEFNLLYRFHCAISQKDEAYTKEFMENVMGFRDPNNTSLPEFLGTMAAGKKKAEEAKKHGKKEAEPWQVEFGIPDASYAVPPGDKQPSKQFKRNPITNLFDDSQMLKALTEAMDDPISNFGPRNVPKCLKAVEIMGILQARKWEVGTLNDFRDFFGMARHQTFESVTKNPEIQNALRDLYEHPDKIELYPGIFCESDENMGLDPGPRESTSALWTAIFSDAITLVRSDRFYTVDWNTNSLTSWGMKEVTPNNDICKSSVFHRLIQRAFPGWFPPDTIRFFHPFYTAKQNAKFAVNQHYTDKFLETAEAAGAAKAENKKIVVGELDIKAEPVQKPKKPVYLDKFDDIAIVLEGEQSKNFTNPAYFKKANLPEVLSKILGQPEPQITSKALDDHVTVVGEDLKDYLDKLMRYIVKRESISMTHSTFQIDATRDFAIPVVTHYVADFLGFGHKLTKDASNASKDTYSENDIYQHITNCQAFLAYSTDETKWMERRRQFQTSMQKLMDLAHHGTIWQASQWDITRALFGKKKTNPMTELGEFVARQVLEYEPDRSKAAAILLLVCLDFAYNAVVSFTATLDEYMKGLYNAANSKKTVSEPEWIKIQKCVFHSDSATGAALCDANDELERMIQRTAKSAFLQPIVRKALVKAQYVFGGKTVEISDGETVILNLAQAEQEVSTNEVKVKFLTSQLNIADKFRVFSPRHFATVSLTSMIAFIAQMRNPRRGRDTQGKLKRIRLDKTPEGYANYMAPMRVAWIKEQAGLLKDEKKARMIYTDRILKPPSDTYLTPNWDEFVPFPMTWKIRFDGFGESDYEKDNHPYGLIRTVKVLPDWCPPWYQPQGPSTVGGTFATLVCVCAGKAGAEGDCPCLGVSKTSAAPKTIQLSTGCGMGDSHVHY
ncbi:Psi-producing oxygenase A [Rhypophila decipiens]|uniref:Psi-producing oxygenase A n=1 Tax=Rhypophila decipiens TaxID=261697 RepID=A0AAN6XWT7_9PEZI|nr:Psi-producing oxygenase A [Rhypophila decipiens]